MRVLPSHDFVLPPAVGRCITSPSFRSSSSSSSDKATLRYEALYIDLLDFSHLVNMPSVNMMMIVDGWWEW
eukprot:CAMPEP_0119563980 /NCGR_PEP_ID=MMETSP1352-20130426/25421_1 /TAXON_ID=265584 /ORGANISM="Stauroneis constricta, Strain CCMP1120" /LENGTH=70 /DNA_ID=CAMNT_0007612675 /DNA_START=349 /DNA_END=558 /DNA_ORIENTATION=+